MLWSRCLLPILVVAVTHDYSGGVCVGEEAHVCHNYGVASSTTRLVSQAEEPVSTCLGPNFRVQWEPSSFHLRVSPCASNRSDGTSKNKTIWETVGRAPFLIAGLGEFEMEEVGMGSFRSKKDNPGRLTVFQTVDHVSYNATALILRGRLSFLHPRRASRGKIDGTKEDGGTGKDASKVGRYSNDEADGEEAVNDNDESAKMNGEIDYILSLSWDEEVSLEHHLSINVEMEGVDGLASGKISHAVLRYASDREESFFGLGEQFSHWNMKGRRLPIYVQEQGIGRGLQPLSFLAEFVETGASGEWHSSYSTIPHYITNKHRSLYLKGYLYSVFDFTKPDSVEITVARAPREGRGALKIAAGVVTGNTMKEHVARYTQYAGRMRQLPDWTVCGGAVLGLEGGTDAVLQAYRAMRGAGTPIAALWIQDWSGFVKDDFGTRVNWNWRLDKEHYPGWEEMVHQIREATGTRVLTYVNPYLSNKQSKDANSAENNLFQQAAKLGFLVRNSSGEPYIQRCASRTFTFGTIDLANPKAVAWFKEEVLERGMIEGSKASGWMADFGEYLPYDSRIGGRVHGQGYSEEEDPEHFHNRFPEEWAKLNAEVVADRSSSGSNGTGTDEGEIVFFCRAISTRSPRHATLFWTGDQMVTWDRHDGLHSALLGVLSGGLSGVALTHSDIGGYTMVERCVLGGAICMYITRDCELLMRWAEMSAFTDAMFRTHLGSGPGPYQAQIFSSNASKAHFSAFARVHQSLCEYRTSLVKEAHSSGLPLARHPMLEFPEDAKTIALETQVMMGPEIMLAPVLSPGITSVAVYLPSPSREGEWWVRWPTLDKVVLEGKEGGGGVITVRARVGEPAVFFLSGFKERHPDAYKSFVAEATRVTDRLEHGEFQCPRHVDSRVDFVKLLQILGFTVAVAVLLHCAVKRMM